MSESQATPSPRRLSRVAGGLYLFIIVFGIAGEVALRGSLVVAGDADATAANILANPGVFRAAFVSDSLMLLADVAIAVVLYLLFRPLSAPLSTAAAAFRLAQAAVIGANLLNYQMALLLLEGRGLAGADTRALAALFLDLHAHGYDLGLIFFAVSNALLGVMLLRAPRLPTWLGWALIAAALVYLAGSYLRFLAPELQLALQPAYAIPLLAELAFCLWLLFRGFDH